MNIKYNVIKLKDSSVEEVKDFVSVEEPLEMNLKYKVDSKWITEHLSITMRTPGHDEDSISGFLCNERIIENFSEIENIEKIGEKVGDFNIQNRIVATINNANNIDIGKIKKNFITNSYCGVCEKTSLETVKVNKKDKINISFTKIQKKINLKTQELLIKEQSEFSKTGGIHASSVINEHGNVIATKEDVGRHNALDKLIGYSHRKKLIDNHSQFIACSGRLNFELIQKGLMSNIGLMAGVGAPTSLAIDLAKRFNMTLIGFVKKNSFNIYTNKERVLL